METFDLSRYDRRNDDLTTYDVYIETPYKTRRIAAFSCKTDAIDFAKLTADRTASDGRAVVVVCRDNSGIVTSFS